MSEDNNEFRIDPHELLEEINDTNRDHLYEYLRTEYNLERDEVDLHYPTDESKRAFLVLLVDVSEMPIAVDEKGAEEGEIVETSMGVLSAKDLKDNEEALKKHVEEHNKEVEAELKKRNDAKQAVKAEETKGNDKETSDKTAFPSSNVDEISAADIEEIDRMLARFEAGNK